MKCLARLRSSQAGCARKRRLLPSPDTSLATTSAVRFFNNRPKSWPTATTATSSCSVSVLLSASADPHQSDCLRSRFYIGTSVTLNPNDFYCDTIGLCVEIDGCILASGSYNCSERLKENQFTFDLIGTDFVVYANIGGVILTGTVSLT